jgi:4-amino-4-deoxy-L-arabinose transferase-like glycosyltransferase
MDKKILVTCILFALLFFVIALNNEFEMLGDTQDYLAMAKSFIDGKPMQDPSRPYELPLIFHPPLYSAALSGFFALFGFSYAGAKIVSFIFAILSMIAFYFLLKKIDVKHKELILLAYSTSVVLLATSARILSDTLFMLLFIAGTYFVLEYAKKEKINDWSGILAAALFALAFYSRVAAAFLMVAVVAYFLLQKQPSRGFNSTQWKKAAFVAIIFGLLILPWLAFYANSQFLHPNEFEKPGSYLNWATGTWGEAGYGIAGIALRFASNLFYFIAEGIPKTILPILLPAFFYLRNTIAMPALLLSGLAVFYFFGKELREKKTSLFGLYIIAYILFFAVQPALDDVTFVDRYMLALLPFLLIFAANILEKGFFAKMQLAKPVLVSIILIGAFLSIGYAFTLEQRMLNEKYVGVKDAIAYVAKAADANEIVIFEAPMHLYLKSGNKAVPNPEIGEKIGAKYAIVDGFSGYSEKDLKGFVEVFETSNGTAAVYRKK